jgi:hypothetical protein
MEVSRPTVCAGCDKTSQGQRRAGVHGPLRGHDHPRAGAWCLDVAPTPGAKPIQYDLLLPAHEGRDDADYYAGYQATARQEPGRYRRQEQLPLALSWRQTLPSVLEWINGPEVAQAVAHVADQRYVLMWPTSHKARDIRRRWRRQAQASKGDA